MHRLLEIRNYRLSNLDLFLTGSEGADNEPVYERISDSNSGVQSDERPVNSVEQQRLTSFLPPPPNIKVLPPGRLTKKPFSTFMGGIFSGSVCQGAPGFSAFSTLTPNCENFSPLQGLWQVRLCPGLHGNFIPHPVSGSWPPLPMVPPGGSTRL